MNKGVFHKIFIAILITLLVLPSLVFAEDKENGEQPNFQEVSIHDPSIIKANDIYYVFGTHIEAAKSTDLISWETFTNGYTTPNNELYGDLSVNLAESFEWAGENDADSKGGFSVWAPEIIWNDSYINSDGATGAYMMYYSVSSTYMRSAIGYAVSQDIEGPYEYVDTIIYSGFTADEDYDDDSEVNKQWENTNIKQLMNDGKISDVNEAWFHSNGDYNNTTYPNAIDANLFYDENGKLWMTYGSWSGGIFMLEIDQETGKAIYPGEDGITEDGRSIDRYFGIHIAVGHWKSGEGPYVVYDEESGYYYLYVTYGFLDATGGYNMRQFRAEKPEGPYLDAAGKDAVLFNDTDNAQYGNKIMSNYLFERGPEEPGMGQGLGYVSPGHNSVYVDPDTNEQFLVFHTRFPNSGEMHQLRIHQMFLNKNDWPVVAPYRYTGETIDANITEEDVIGEYKYINHQKDNSDKLNRSQLISFNEDQTISGAVEGNWSIDGHYAEIMINNITYDGVFVKQWIPASGSYETTFTALSDKGVSVWGSKSTQAELTDEEIVAYVKDHLKLGKMNGVVSDIVLPTEGEYETEISWESSHPEIVSNQGIVNRPNADMTVTLTATINKNNITDTKTFTVNVQPETGSGLIAYYPFNGNLENDISQEEAGTITGNRIDNTGGAISFGDGKLDEAAVFDGSSGVLLPDGLITSNKYTVSLWINPEEMTDFTTTFFGAASPESWVSLVPKGHDGVNHDTMVWSGEDWYDAGLGKELPLDEWTHVAFTVDDGSLDVYLNGTKEFSGTDFPNIFTSADAVFGLGVNYWDIPFKGLMDELLIYDEQVLTEEEIIQYYSDGTIPGMDSLEEDKDSTNDSALTNPVLWLVLVALVVGIVALILVKKKKSNSNQ